MKIILITLPVQVGLGAYLSSNERTSYWLAVCCFEGMNEFFSYIFHICCILMGFIIKNSRVEYFPQRSINYCNLSSTSTTGVHCHY